MNPPVDSPPAIGLPAIVKEALRSLGGGDNAKGAGWGLAAKGGLGSILGRLLGAGHYSPPSFSMEQSAASPSDP